MRRPAWLIGALTFLTLGIWTGGANEAKAQWFERQTVRYGLLGRPRSVETRIVPGVTVMPTTTVVSTGEVIGTPVFATRAVRAVPAPTVLPTFSEVVPATFVSSGSEVVPATFVSSPMVVPTTRVLTPSPVMRTYVPTVRTINSPVYILP